jgi:hypothetical protein
VENSSVMVHILGETIGVWQTNASVGKFLQYRQSQRYDDNTRQKQMCAYSQTPTLRLLYVHQLSQQQFYVQINNFTTAVAIKRSLNPLATPTLPRTLSNTRRIEF